MRKFVCVITMLIAFVSANAQYKKASFLNKTGRIYDVGATYIIQNGERSSSMGFFLSYGKEKSTKRLHHWFDLEFDLGNKYSYTTTSYYSSPDKVQVTGKTSASFAYRYNLAYFLADNSNEEKKILPFVNLSLGLQLGFSPGIYSESPDSYSAEILPVTDNTNFHFGGGAGILYRINPTIGIRASVAYYVVANGAEPAYEFSTLANHPAVNLAVRFRMDRDDD